MSDDPPRPLIVTADPVLLEEVGRLAAAAGVVPDVVAEVPAALRAWAAAPLILLGNDRADAVAAAGPPRRAGVHLVTLGTAGEVYPAALACAAESVRCLPPSAEAVIGDLTDCADGRRESGTVIGVVAGSGGVGATVLATALAQVIAETTDVLLLDADPAGAGIDRVLGTELVDGVRWDGLVQAAGRLSARSLYDALPRRGRVAVLTWPSVRRTEVTPAALRGAVSAARRGFPVVVADLARLLDPVAVEAAARCDRIVLVSTLTIPAVTAAARVAPRLPAGSGLVLRGPDGGLTPQEVSGLLGLPVLARMRDQRGVDEAIGLGLGPVRSRRGRLARAAHQVAGAVLA